MRKEERDEEGGEEMRKEERVRKEERGEEGGEG